MHIWASRQRESCQGGGSAQVRGARIRHAGQNYDHLVISVYSYRNYTEHNHNIMNLLLFISIIIYYTHIYQL